MHNPYAERPEPAPPATLADAEYLVSECIGFDGTADTRKLRRALLTVIRVLREQR